MVDGRDLPWLQDVAGVDVWTAWDVTYRDVIILDKENRPVAVFNLTENNLSEAADYDELLTLFTSIAEAEAAE